METCFAAPDRAAPDELERELALVATSKVVEGLLTSVGGLLAILNDRRQIMAVNDAFFRAFDIEDVGGMIGLRPGEAIGCLHAEEEPAGCGTTRFCPTCGAAVAIVTSMADQRPVERVCAAEVLRHGEKMDLYLEVRAVPFTCGGKEFLLLFLRDVTREQQWASEERVLFRVLGNMLVNALEASREGDTVRLGAILEADGRVRFTVWNREPIPEEVRCRIFQKNFSTRKGMGRGLGTWSMKYFGEKFLGGEVGFVSSRDEGTRFYLTIPRRNLSRPAVAVGRERPEEEVLLPSWAGPAGRCQADTTG